MEYDDVVRTTFAARQFTDESVPDDLLWEVLDVARFAPSGGNRQGAHVTVIRDDAVKRSIAELSKTGARRYLAQRAAGENPWNPVHPSTVAAEDAASVSGADAFVAPLTAAPVLLVVSVNLSVVAAMDKDLDRVGLVSGGSVYPLVWNILTAARSRGLGGTVTTMAVVEEDRVRTLLRLPDEHAVAAVLPIGQPVRQLSRLRRAAVEEFVTIGSFDGRALVSPGS